MLADLSVLYLSSFSCAKGDRSTHKLLFSGNLYRDSGAVVVETRSKEGRRFICDNALMWLRDYCFDGLRFDAIHTFADHTPQPLLRQVAQEVRDLSRTTGRRYLLIAESDLNDPRVVTPLENEGALSSGAAYGFDAQWSDDFHYALFAFLSGERQGYYQDFGNPFAACSCSVVRSSLCSTSRMSRRS